MMSGFHNRSNICLSWNSSSLTSSEYSHFLQARVKADQTCNSELSNFSHMSRLWSWFGLKASLITGSASSINAKMNGNTALRAFAYHFAATSMFNVPLGTSLTLLIHPGVPELHIHEQWQPTARNAWAWSIAFWIREGKESPFLLTGLPKPSFTKPARL